MAELKDELTAKLGTSMDAQYATLALDEKDEHGAVIYFAATWNGTTTVTTAKILAIGDHIRLASDGNWFKVTGTSPGMSVSIEDVYVVGIPTGVGNTSRAVVAPPPKVSGTSGLDPFAQGIAGAVAAAPHQLPSASKTALPPASPAGRMIYVTDDVGGAVPAFSDGAEWRRVTNRAVIA